jgi:molybdopterin-guanine dinucleotide biosynthesis protein A
MSGDVGLEVGLDAGAILLAGGRASRVDGAVKPLFEVGGQTLLGAAVQAMTDAAADPITVASDVLDAGLPVEWVREDPPFGGPVAGIVAALSRWRERGDKPEWTFVLACDLPGIAAAVSLLRDTLALLPGDSDGVCLGDESSRPQWLTGLYRTASLERTAAALPDAGANAAVRSLVDELAVTVVRAPRTLTDDVDTWEDLTTAQERATADHVITFEERND